MRHLRWLLAAWLVMVMFGAWISSAPTEGKAAERDRADVLLDVFGEFRTVLARYLWFKMDLFHEVLEDEGIDNAKQVEVLPLLRMISLLDPSMVDAYDNIAWDLYHGHRQTEQALQILEEGLAKNHNNFQLNFRYALILYKEKRMQEAMLYSQVAVSLAQDEFDILNANRLLYNSSKTLDAPDVERQALTNLLSLRPHEKLWQDALKRLSGP